MFSRDVARDHAVHRPSLPVRVLGGASAATADVASGDQLRWRTRMIVLTLEPQEAEKLAEGAPTLQRGYGMPIDPAPYARPASSQSPRCRAVVATRLRAPALEQALLRRLRVRTMLTGQLDDPQLLAAAAYDVGIDPSELTRWCAEDETDRALSADVAAARRPSPAARALDHKFGGPVDDGATPRRATRSPVRQTKRRSRFPASIRSRPMRPRSQTSPPTSSAGQSLRPSPRSWSGPVSHSRRQRSRPLRNWTSRRHVRP